MSFSPPRPANAVRPALDLPRNLIPAPAVIEALPAGHQPQADTAACAARVAKLLRGRQFTLVSARAAWNGSDTTPVINVWTGPAVRQLTSPDVEWLCTVVLPEGARLDLLEPLIRAEAHKLMAAASERAAA